MASHLTEFGLPDIGVVPHGFHVCHFFRTRQDLVDAAVPFLLAGLKNNERCLWIAAHPLAIAEIEAEVARNPELERGVASGELRILDAAHWFGETLTSEQLVQHLLDEEERAIAEQRQGLRLSANTMSFAGADWPRLIDYAARLHGLLRDRRIVACSSYSSETCQPVDMLDVVRCHDAVLERSDQYWQMFFPEVQGLHSPKYTTQRPSRKTDEAPTAP
jgi:hypothetical protein